MKYLVTGGSGFIGSHLIEQLLNLGHSVINIDNFDDFYDYRIKISNTFTSTGKKLPFTFESREKDIARAIKYTSSDRYSLWYLDIRNKEALAEVFRTQKPDFVIHLAALAGVRPSIERPLDYEEVNIRGTMNIWELCREFDVRKFICASSSSVYGNNEKVPFSEEDPVDRPVSPYAATKRCGEILGHVYHHLYKIDMIQLRFFTVYGPRQRPDLVIHKFTKLISEGREVPFYGNGSTARDYTYIDDIVSGILKAAEFLQKHQGVYEIVNLGESQVINLNEMLATVEDFLDKKALIKELPHQPGDVPQTYADITKAKEMLGYKPATDFRNGIKKFVEWFLRK